MAIRVVCVTVDGGYQQNPYLAISLLGWVEIETGKRGSSTRAQMYDMVKNGAEVFVKGPDGGRVYLTAEETATGAKLVKAEFDGVADNHLFNLGPCK